MPEREGEGGLKAVGVVVNGESALTDDVHTDEQAIVVSIEDTYERKRNIRQPQAGVVDSGLSDSVGGVDLSGGFGYKADLVGNLGGYAGTGGTGIEDGGLVLARQIRGDVSAPGEGPRWV